MDHEAGVARVFFVDFGNRQTLNFATSSQDIKPLAPIFIENMPPYAYRCGLIPSKMDEDEKQIWSQEEVNDFKDAVLEKEFSATFLRAPDSMGGADGDAPVGYIVRLKEGVVVVGEHLVNRYSFKTADAKTTTRVVAPPAESPSFMSVANSSSTRNDHAGSTTASPYTKMTLPPGGDKLGERYHPVSTKNVILFLSTSFDRDLIFWLGCTVRSHSDCILLSLISQNNNLTTI